MALLLWLRLLLALETAPSLCPLSPKTGSVSHSSGTWVLRCFCLLSYPCPCLCKQFPHWTLIIHFGCAIFWENTPFHVIQRLEGWSPPYHPRLGLFRSHTWDPNTSNPIYSFKLIITDTKFSLMWFTKIQSGLQESGEFRILNSQVDTSLNTGPWRRHPWRHSQQKPFCRSWLWLLLGFRLWASPHTDYEDHCCLSSLGTQLKAD